MDDRSTGSPFGDTIALLAQPAALLAGVVFAAVQFGRIFAMNSLIARAQASGNYSLVSMAGMGAGVFIFLVFAIVHFLLSRKLGGPEDSEGEPGIAAWFGLMFVYFMINQLVTFLMPIVISQSGLGFSSYPIIMGGVSFVLRLVFFPVMVFLAALAHDGEQCTFGDIWSFLTARAIGWFGGYVLLALAVTFIPSGIMSALDLRPGNSESSGMLVSALLIAIGQLLPILYAIAAYRAARASKDQGGQMLF